MQRNENARRLLYRQLPDRMADWAHTRPNESAYNLQSVLFYLIDIMNDDSFNSCANFVCFFLSFSSFAFVCFAVIFLLVALISVCCIYSLFRCCERLFFLFLLCGVSALFFPLRLAGLPLLNTSRSNWFEMSLCSCFALHNVLFAQFVWDERNYKIIL